MVSKRRPAKPRETLGSGLRVALYLRQSDTKGVGADSLSLESQEAVLRDRCRREDWQIVEPALSDPDLKGWMNEADRPGIRQIFALAERRAIDLVLIWKGDRWARDVEMQERLCRELALLGVEVESHTEPAWRTTLLVRVLLGAMAQQTTWDISDNVSRALRERTQRGLPHGRAPWGYLRAAPNGPLIPDPAVAPIAAALFEARAAGASVRDCLLLAIHLCDQASVAGPGPSGWYWTIVDRILRNPVYRGAVRFGGVVVEDAHPGLISAPLWHAAQHQAKQYRRRSDPALSWLAGLVDHACGGAMYLQGPDGRTHHEPWLACPNLGRGGTGRTCRIHPAQVQTPRIERLTWAAIGEGLARLREPEQVATEAKARLAALGPDVGKQRRAAERALAKAEERREKAIEMYLDGTIDARRRDAEFARAGEERAAAEAELAAMPAGPSLAQARAMHDRLRTLAAGLHVTPPTGRSPILASLGRAMLLPAHGADPGKRNPGRIEIVWRPELARYFHR